MGQSHSVVWEIGIAKTCRHGASGSGHLAGLPG